MKAIRDGNFHRSGSTIRGVHDAPGARVRTDWQVEAFPPTRSCASRVVGTAGKHRGGSNAGWGPNPSRESGRGDDHGRRLKRDGLRLTSHPARTVGVPAAKPRRDVTLVRPVHEHTVQ